MTSTHRFWSITALVPISSTLTACAACRHVFSFTHQNLQRNKNDCFVLLPYCTAPLVFWTSKRLKEVELWPFRGIWGVWRSVKCDIPYTISLNLWEEQKNSRGGYLQLDLKFGALPSKSLKVWSFGYKSTCKKKSRSWSGQCGQHAQGLAGEWSIFWISCHQKCSNPSKNDRMVIKLFLHVFTQNFFFYT